MSLQPLTETFLKQLRSGNAEQVDIALTRAEAQGFDLSPWQREYEELSACIEIPENKSRFENIAAMYASTKVDLSGQAIKSIPEAIRQLKNLEVLLLNNNEITVLPDWIGEKKQLKELQLRGNQLENLPSSIGYLENLEQLDLSANRLTKLAHGLFQLKNLQKLNFLPTKIHFGSDPPSFPKIHFIR
jgi:leucine-rich repeat protein SHOC2